MIPIVRIYASEEKALAAARALEEAGFEDVALIANVAAGEEASTVRAAIDAGSLPGSHAAACTRCLEQGQAIVSVRALFGSGQRATDLLELHEPVDTELLPRYSPRDPSPFSDLLGIPVLTKYTPMTDLSIIKYTFGEPSVSGRSATPLSSLVGLKPLVDFGKKSKSFGLALLSRDAAPLSSLLRLKTLTSASRDRQTSFGLPLLSRNATPLSSLFGLRVLSKRKPKSDRD